MTSTFVKFHRAFLAAVVILCLANASRAAHDHSFCRVVIPTARASRLAAAPAIDPIGTRKLLYLRIRYAGETEDPVSVEDANAELTEANEILERNSFGKFRLIATITPVVTLPTTPHDYAQPGGFDRLLADARAAGSVAGFDHLDYELDVVRHSGVSTFQAGNAMLGSRGIQIQAPGAVILVHEIGHNLGLLHANFWDTSTPPFAGASPPMPSNFLDFPDLRSIPIYPDSAVGHASVDGAGTATEYGDPWDIMGTGIEQFNAAYKHALGWLREGNVVTVNNDGTYRLFGADGVQIRSQRTYALQINAGSNETWVQLAPQSVSETAAKVSLRWYNSVATPITSLLLDATLKLPAANSDTFLELGRTHSQMKDGVHITALATGFEEGDRWVDVAVHRSSRTTNQSPSVALTASRVEVAVDESVTLQVIATDPDGDPLAWHWEFQDGTVSTASGTVTKSWRRKGDFVVLLSISDLKGGLALAHLAVRVGQPNTARVQGQVLNEAGQPVPGVKIHNGVVGSSNDRSPYRWTVTDSKGRYTLTDLLPGVYTNGAYLYGWVIGRVPPLVVEPGLELTQNYSAVALPALTITSRESASESSGIVSLFTLERGDDTTKSLTINYGFGGSAQAGSDYIRPFISRVTFPAGERSANVVVNLIDDRLPEPLETLSLEPAIPSDSIRIDALGNPYTVYYPGWDIIEINQQPFLVQTDPPLRVLADGPVKIVDDDFQLSARLGEDGVVTLILSGNPGERFQLEFSAEIGQWQFFGDFVVPLAGTLEIPLPAPGFPARFFRLQPGTPSL